MKFQSTNGKITVLLKSGPKSISNTDPKYNLVLEAIQNDDEAKLEEILDVSKKVATFSNGKFSVKDGAVYYGEEILPEAISRKIISYIELNLPPDSLLKFWENVNLNPSYRSKNQLFSFLEANDHPFTDDGCFIAYRAVRADFMDKYTGTMDNSPGKIVSMERNKVNDDPNQTCSYGLHVANFSYASTVYGSAGDKLIAVKVNPLAVVAVPPDYNEAKMRVCEFEVLHEIQNEYKTPLYTPPVNSFSDDLEGDEVCEGNNYCEECEECQDCGSCSCEE